MKGEELNYFVYSVYLGEEVYMKYKGVVYFIQGWIDNQVFTLCMVDDSDCNEGYLYYESSLDQYHLSKKFF